MADNDDLGLTQEDINAGLPNAASADAASPDSPEIAEAPGAPALREPGDVVSQTDIDAVLAQAENAASQLAGESHVGPTAEDDSAEQEAMDQPFHDAGAEAARPQMPDFDAEDADPAVASKIDLLNDVQLHVKIELGRSRMLVEDVLKLSDGSVVELDKLAGDPVDVYVNERLVARGEVLVLNDNFCVRISEIISKMEVEAPVGA
jgi:flagellar motor switch protein FliN/FliY